MPQEGRREEIQLVDNVAAGHQGDMQVSTGGLIQQQPLAEDHLMNYLWKQYRAEVTEQSDAELEAQYVFACWCVKHLNNVENRPSTSFAAPANIGIVLNNNVRLVVSKPRSQDGDGAMVQTPLGAEQARGVPQQFANQGAIPITGVNLSRKGISKAQSDGQQKNFRNDQTPGVNYKNDRHTELL